MALSPPRYGIDTADRSGRPLPGGVRAKMERSFASDFSRVRVHEGAEAGRIGAQAFARGTDIHFAPGTFEPHTELGQARIGHELAHVVQQSRGLARTNREVAGIGVDDSRSLERQADLAGARAALGRPAGLPGHASSSATLGAVVQRAVTGSNLREVLNWQRDLQQRAVATPATYAYKYTTVGFEHEFAAMTDGPLHGVDHFEISRSSAPVLPLTNIPFVLETDAGNEVELVSPPFMIETRSSGTFTSRSKRKPVPLADDLAKIDGFIRSELHTAISQTRRRIRTPRPNQPHLFDYDTEYDNKTLTDVANTLRANTGIDFGFRKAEVEPYQLSPATVGTFSDDNAEVSGATLGGIHVKPSSKGAVGHVHDGEKGAIITQINFATTAKVADELQRASEADTTLRPVADAGIVAVFRGVESNVRTLLIGAANPTNKLRRFYNTLARSLSGQLAVPYLAYFERAQNEAMEWGRKMTDLEEYPVPLLSQAESISSHVKDTSGVWLKDMVINFGLERLSREEWTAVLARVTDPLLVRAIQQATMVDFPDPPITLEQVPANAGMIETRMIQMRNQKLQQKYANRKAGNRTAVGAATVAALARVAAIIANDIRPDVEANFATRVGGLHFGQGDGERLEFGQHNPTNIGPRQDTYIKSQNVQTPLWATRRLHVVETRGDSLEKQLELIRRVGG